MAINEPTTPQKADLYVHGTHMEIPLSFAEEASSLVGSPANQKREGAAHTLQAWGHISCHVFRNPARSGRIIARNSDSESLIKRNIGKQELARKSARNWTGLLRGRYVTSPVYMYCSRAGTRRHAARAPTIDVSNAKDSNARGGS